jgi:hypothetical protein
MKWNKAVLWCFTLFAATFFANPSFAADFYKYTNEEGVTVLASEIPARYVKGGYTILNEKGRVIEVVPPALSDDEIRERDKKLAEIKAREKEAADRKTADLNLLRIYSTPDDVIRTRDTKITSIQGFISTSTNNMARLEFQKRSMDSDFADIERAGGQITTDRLRQMRNIETRIRQNGKEILAKKEEMAAVQDSFAVDLKRVRELYDKQERDHDNDAVPEDDDAVPGN